MPCSPGSASDSALASVTGFAAVGAAEPAPPPREQRRRRRVELSEGLGTQVGQPVLPAFLATMLTAQFFYSVIMAIYLLYLTRELGLSPAALGAIFGLGGGVGVLVGAALASRVSAWLGVGPTLVLSHGLFGLPLALATLWPAFAVPLVFAAELLQLGVNAVYQVNRASVEQTVTPPHLRGRVRAGDTAAHALAGALGILVGGLLGETLGMGSAIWVGVVGGLFSFLWLRVPPIRELRTLSVDN
jgi:predicted MFS family arabinose efflux permease